jgi:hypothetical protein
MPSPPVQMQLKRSVAECERHPAGKKPGWRQARAIMLSEGETITRAVLQKARKADLTCLPLMLARICPVPRDENGWCRFSYPH